MNERIFFYRLGKLVYGLDGVYEEYGRNCRVGSPNLLWILYALNDGERHSQKQICADWSIPRSTANTIIKDLESKQYVALSQIKGERRELLVSLTACGKGDLRGDRKPRRTAFDVARFGGENAKDRRKRRIK